MDNHWKSGFVVISVMSLSGCLTDQVTRPQLEMASRTVAQHIKTTGVGKTDAVGENAALIPIVGVLVAGDNDQINSQRSEGWASSGTLEDRSVAVVIDSVTRGNVFSGGAKSFAAGARTAVVPLGEALAINAPVVFGSVYRDVSVISSSSDAKPDDDLVITPSIIDYEHVYGGGFVSTISSNITLGLSVSGGGKSLYSGRYQSGFVGSDFSAGSEFSSSSHAENHAYAVTGAVMAAMGKGIDDYRAQQQVRNWLSERDKNRMQPSNRMSTARFGLADNLLEMLSYWQQGGEIDGAQFQRAIGYAEELATDAGYDVTRLRQLHEIARSSVRRADFEAGLDDTLSAEEKAVRISEVRTATYRRVNLAYLTALLSETPAASVTHMRDYANAVRTIGGADALDLARQADMIAAEQKLVATMVSGVPLVGEAVDLYSVAAGEHVLTGEELGAVDYAFAALPLLPSTISTIARQSDNAVSAFSRAVAVSEANPILIASAVSRNTDDVLNMTETLSKQHVKIGSSALDGFNARAMSKINEFVETTAGQTNRQAWQRVEQEGAAKANAALQAMGDKSANELLSDQAFLEAYQAARSDTRAVAALKQANTGERSTLFRFEEHLFGQLELTPSTGQLINNGKGVIDQDAFNSIANDLAEAINNPAGGSRTDAAWTRIQSEMRNKAGKAGMINADESFDIAHYVDPNDLKFEVLNVTNKPPKVGDIGSDRDITYRLVTNRTDKHGIPLKVDLPAEFVEEHYLTALYRKLNPGKAPKTGNELQEWGAAIDHTVTDEWALDAYRPGMDIFSFVNDRSSRVSSVAAEDMKQTFAYKGHEWFERAKAAASNNELERALALKAEGARQIWKQYENLIVARLPDGTSVGQALPLKAQKTYFWLRNIGEKAEFPDGSIRTVSPVDAEIALGEIGLSLDQAGAYLADTFEAVIKLRPEMRGAGA